MRTGLYQKIFLWLLFNLILLGLMGCMLVGVVLLKGSGGLLPTYLFSNNVENAFRTISAHCQYKPSSEWPAILEQHNQGARFFYTMYPLEESCDLTGLPPIPPEVAETAENMPKYPFTLCPDPRIVLPAFDFFSESNSHINQSAVSGEGSGRLEAGILPSPRVLFMRAGEPPRYWLARALFIPDDEQNLHYVLLSVSSESIFGYGLFFDLGIIGVILGGGLVVSCLWWLPFVRHISRPLLKMTAVSEKLAADAPGTLASFSGDNICGVEAGRDDEIGRLARSIHSMAEHLHRNLARQRQFISHIAQEINSPLAGIRQGLAELDEGASPAEDERLQGLVGQVEHLAMLTDDILNFLRDESEHQVPVFEKMRLCSLLRGAIRAEAGQSGARLSCPHNLTVTSSRRYLRRAVRNALRNAVKHANAPEVLVSRQDGKIRIDILDSGPGVPEEDLPLLGQPFFRSGASRKSGSGLGLSIVKYCVDACKGTVIFANRESGGFAVSILIPAD